MKHLFSTEGHAALVSVMSLRPLLAFDFDGTLAPIVSHPDDARVPLAVARRLDHLSKLLVVAVITGRSIADVRDRLGFLPQFVIGNHGAEDPLSDRESDKALLEELRARLLAASADLEHAGIFVEDKIYSIALHYRLSRDRDRALKLIHSLLGGLGDEVKIFGGKLVVNVTPAQAPDKAEAVASVVRRSQSSGAVFLGDDLNDEPVFSRQEPTWLTVRVGCDYPGTQAKFFLNGPSEVASLLDRMLTLLPSGHPPA